MTETWTVPGFTEVRELGDGATGRVVAAVDDVTQTPVVIKYVDPRLLRDASFRTRYTGEVRRLTRVEDPNLVQVVADVETPQGFAVVMEQVDGVSLREMLRGLGPLGPLAALVAFSHSLAGLASAHAIGILHRDYRPENVLVDSSGLCKLTDLGLDLPPHGSTGVSGHPSYAAPELWSGDEPSTASDIYAATVAFFECLTGRRPFRSQRSSESRAMTALSKAHRTEPVPVEAVPGPLRDLLLVGTAKDPAGRPSSAADFVAIVDDAATAAYGPSWESQGRGRLVEIAELVIASPPPPREPSGQRSRQHGGTRTPQHHLPSGPQSAPGRPQDVPPIAGPPGPWPTPGPAGMPGPAGHPAGQAGPREFRPTGAGNGMGMAAGDPAAGWPGSAPGGSGYAGYDADAGYPPNGDPSGGQAQRRTDGHAYGPRSGPAAEDGSGSRSIRPWHVAAGAVAAAAVAGAVIYGLNGHDETHPTRPSAQQSTPTPAPGASNGPGRPPTTASALSTRISRAVAARKVASFVYRKDAPGTAGTAAQGVLRLVPRGSTSYDMVVRNPDQPGTAQRPTRVVLVANTAYVRIGAAWRQVPTATATAARADDPRAFAGLAAETRWSSSVYDISALLAASGSLSRDGLVYSGTAAPAKLVRSTAVAPLYRTLLTPVGQQRVSFTIEVGPDFLPRRLQITVTPKGKPAAATVLRVKYSGWGRGAAIRPPV